MLYINKHNGKRQSTFYTVVAENKIAFDKLKDSDRKGLSTCFFENNLIIIYMEKIEFITMTGIETSVDRSLLWTQLVSQKAEKHYGVKVKCTPGVFGMGSSCVGWRIVSKENSELKGFLVLTTGWFLDYPADFEYGINLFIPLSRQWSDIFQYRIRYVDDRIDIMKNV